MTPEGWIAIGILVATALIVVRRWAPPEFVALGIPVVLVVTGVLDPAMALGGFGNHAVIALGAIFVVGAGLQGSGLASLVARAILKSGEGSLTDPFRLGPALLCPLLGLFAASRLSRRGPATRGRGAVQGEDEVQFACS